MIRIGAWRLAIVEVSLVFDMQEVISYIIEYNYPTQDKTNNLKSK